jgi:group I intron endonuclease
MDIPKATGAYKITHPKSGLYYIGSSSNIYERYHVHLSTLKSNTHKNPRLQEVFNDDPVISIETIVTDSRDEAYDVEQKYLDRCVGKPNCTNVHNCARGSWLPGTAPAEKMAAFAAAGHEANRNRTYSRGHKHSEEAKEKIRAAAARRDPSTYPRGQKRSEETRAKMRIMNSRPRRKGQVFSEERKANMAAAAKVRAEQLKVTVVVDNVSYPSISEAAAALGVTRRTVSVRLKDPRYPEYNHGVEQAPISV